PPRRSSDLIAVHRQARRHRRARADAGGGGGAGCFRGGDDGGGDPHRRPPTQGSDGMTGQRLLLVLLAVATLGATAMVTLVTLARSGEQPILEGGAEKPDPQFHVPDFTLTDQFNQPYGTEQLAGKV